MSMPSYINLDVKKSRVTDGRYPNFSLVEYLEQQNIKYSARDSDDHIEYSTNCPKCVERGEKRPDSKGRLWINSKKGTFYCYNCQWNGPLVRLVQQFSNASYESALKILRGKSPNPFEHLNFSLHQTVYDDDDIEEVVSAIELPRGFKSFDENHSDGELYRAYLDYRGIPLKYAVSHGWGYTESGYMHHRIIVPTYINDDLVYWQGRDVLESAHPDWGTDTYRKVRNPKGISANKVLYNYDNAKHFNEIVICEGFIDACKVGDNAVATNGKHLHPAQMELLSKTDAEGVVIIWDYDAYEDAVYEGGRIKKKCSAERAADMLRSCFEVRHVRLPEGVDAGDYEVGELRDLIAE